MLPKKAKQAVLSLVTTEPSKHGGPPKSTTSTVSADWDNDLASSSIPNTSTQSTEPNSGSTDWMVVSGATYHSNPVPVPTNVSTPLIVREEQLNRLPALQLLERSEDTDPVLDVDVAHQIRLELPRKLRNATKWNLVYSSDQHGISMTTLYHRCRGKGPMILAVKDSYDCVFGAFINEELKPNLSYYGTGECFLWNVTTLSSPKAPASPSFGPSPLPSPSPLQLSSTFTTPGTGRSPSPSLSPLPGTYASRAAQIGENRRQDLLQAMSDQLSVGAQSPSPSPLSPFTTHGQHATNSPSYSPTLRPVTSSNVSTPPGTGATISTTPPSSTGASVPVVSIPRRKKKQKVVQFWRWSGKNDYMVLSEPGFIGLGGGDGKFGLWIHSDLERGHSARCATFENEPLAAACRHPIRGTSVNGHIELAPAKTLAKTTGHEGHGNGGGPERSASPSENEEFYCQTVEIWSLAL
ncbi:oxidation resistance protein 1 [Podila verticillata]|nr:oxidation resistance protein 1 [Podila verticillata]